MWRASAGAAGKASSSGVLGGKVPRSLQSRFLSTRRASLLAYWPCTEASGTAIVDSSGNGRNGVYGPVAVGQPNGLDGPAPQYDGSTGFGNVYSASLAGAFNPNELTMVVWCKCPTSAWADGVQRKAFVLQTSSSIRAALYKSATANVPTWLYQAGGISSGPGTIALTTLPGDWFCLGLTVSKSADQMISYYNGVPFGAIATGLGTWAGALSTTQCNLGATTTAALNPWLGQIGHGGVWSAALTPGEMLTVGLP